MRNLHRPMFRKEQLSNTQLVLLMIFVAIALAACGDDVEPVQQVRQIEVSNIGRTQTTLSFMARIDQRAKLTYELTGVKNDHELYFVSQEFGEEMYDGLHFAWFEGLRPGQKYRLVTKATNAAGTTTRDQDFFTDPEVVVEPKPDVEEEPEFVFEITELKPLTSRINRLAFHSSKLVMLDVFYADNSQSSSRVQTYKDLRQTSPENFDFHFWNNGDQRKVVLIAYTEDGDVVRRALDLERLAPEIAISVSSITSNSISVLWSAVDGNRSCDYVSVQCSTSGWSNNGKTDERGNVKLGRIEIQGLRPGTSYDCWAHGNDHVLDLPIESDHFTVTTLSEL